MPANSHFGSDTLRHKPNTKNFRGFLFVAIFAIAVGAWAQTSKKDKGTGLVGPTTRLHIAVTGGDANKPVSEASVYVKWLQEGKLHKSKTLEMDLKTNEEGIAASQEVPQGKILIQVVVPDWKTYGMWFDVNQSEQSIEVHLVRPSSN